MVAMCCVVPFQRYTTPANPCTKHNNPAQTPLKTPPNPRHTDNEPKAGLLRIVASGGRASEPLTPGPGGIGSVGVGTRTLSEGGAMGDWSREEVSSSRVKVCDLCSMRKCEGLWDGVMRRGGKGRDVAVCCRLVKR